ncbi:MAG: inositol monophosphatase [Anaeromicrobium sp.]|jgi:myo-inositol-1(or 4)-monophosphatase|uniref:inositol monophosphatase family protein n=1 Tax=Anaeromicrobium sp. TaxID=1929132 RepID=UPI0025E6E520|nr:inositol monophosphatase family protein [Anaeromicrobium sp.]MCT4592986.1 inositol monophosphatase [Anaeromicrobium sp.]
MVVLKEVLENAKKWAREIGEIQRKNYNRADLKYSTKSNHSDFVTEVDELCENELIKLIQTTYPNHGILGEETGKSPIESDYVWIIDPIDGTTNFLYGSPRFSVCIGLRYKDEGVLGVVYFPILDEMFCGVKGEGAYLNGKKIKIGTKKKLKECVVVTGFSYDKDKNPENNVEYASKIIPKVKGIRRMGAASYDIVNVACGRIDGYWEMTLGPWDVEAANVVLKEAGGSVEFLDRRHIFVVVGNEHVVDEILKEIKE